MQLCGGSNRGRLQQNGVTVHAVDLLKSTGEMTVVCLDKTGTLTGSRVGECLKCFQLEQVFTADVTPGQPA